MKTFLKPSKGKILLTIFLFIVFVFLGASHVQICKLPPCVATPIYSSIIITMALWPFVIAMAMPRFWNFFDTIIPLLIYILWVFYYYLLACLWFYEKDTWKVKNYVLLIIAFIVIIFSVSSLFSNGEILFGPKLGETIDNK